MSVRIAALWSMGAQYASFAIHFIVSVAIARFFLAPDEVGLFSVALSAAMLLAVVQDFGIGRYVSGEPDLNEDQIRACHSISILFAFAVGALILASAWPLARFYGDERLLPVMATIAGSYIVAPFSIVPAALLHRQMDFKALFIVNVGSAFVNGAAALGLAAAGFSAMSLALAAIAHQTARAILAQWKSRITPFLFLRLKGAEPIFRFGSGASLLYISGALGSRAPELIIGRLIGIAAVGLYSRAIGLTDHLRMLVAGAIGAVFYPAFARIRDNGEDMAAPYVRVVAGYSAIIWPAMTFLAAAATPLVLILFGPRWAEAAPLLKWVALSEIMFTMLPLHMEIPILLGRMRMLLKLNLLDTAASVGLLAFAALWSLEAAAFSRMGYGLIWLAIYAIFMRTLIGFRWSDLIAVYIKSMAASAACVTPFVLIYWNGRAPQDIDLATLCALAVAGAGCWLAAIFSVRHPVCKEIRALFSAMHDSFPLLAARIGKN